MLSPTVNIPNLNINTIGGRAGGLFNASGFWLPLSDAGAGAVDLTLARGTGSATFTRATTTWTKLASGLWASVASGTAASFYLGFDDSVGSYGGYLPQPARTNSALWSRDLTNAAWVKTNATAAQDAMGIDGVANSASTLTATAGNATALQTLAAAATSRAYAPWIRRVTGSGTIQITQDGGGSWTTVTVTSTWAKVTDLVASILNPVFGIRIVTSGDAIAVDMNQLEAGTYATTPIPTTTAAVTRNTDVLTYPFSGNASATVGTAYAEISQPASAAPITTGVLYLSDATGRAIYNPGGDPTGVSSFDGTGVVNSNTSNYLGVIAKTASSWGGSTRAICLNGGTPGTGSFDGSMGPGTGNILISPSVAPWSGTIKNVRIYQTQFSAAQLQAITV